MFAVEDIINKLVEDMQKLWKYRSEQFGLENSSSEEHFLLLHLKTSNILLRV